MRQQPSTHRDPWFDNAKFLLICLVVVGHSWALLEANATEDWLYRFLYAWHMPAFALITGHFSRSFTWSPRRLRSLVTTVAIPYVVFEGALAWVQVHLGHRDLHDLWINPHWPMWYLAALFVWRLLTPVLLRVPAPVTVSVLASLTGGLWAGDVLDLSRIVGMLPFFVLGLTLHRGHWELLNTPRARLWALATMATLLGLARVPSDWVPTEWLYYRTPYAGLDTNLLQAASIRMVLLIVGTAGALAFLALAPRRHSWLTGLGTATIVVYLFHGFAVLPVRFSGFPAWSVGHPVLGLAVTTAGAVVVATLLAWPPVSRRLHVLVDPIGSLQRLRSATSRQAGPAGRTEVRPVPAIRCDPPLRLPAGAGW
ncbi:acyltransferase family protein [Nocardioides terrisoli]|uniref:acyltransferase family protein n=1 Tax=Nocardioides terrisoli TaxID=3388267 RepID=UPI00287B8144|nr:acyltransferase family protein [Nocardioides marmorisolisilvae]